MYISVLSHVLQCMHLYTVYYIYVCVCVCVCVRVFVLSRLYCEIVLLYVYRTKQMLFCAASGCCPTGVLIAMVIRVQLHCSVM